MAALPIVQHNQPAVLIVGGGALPGLTEAVAAAQEVVKEVDHEQRHRGGPRIGLHRPDVGEQAARHEGLGHRGLACRAAGVHHDATRQVDVLAYALGGQKRSVLFIFLLSFCLGASALLIRNADSLDALLLIIQASIFVVLITILERRGRTLAIENGCKDPLV